MLPTGDVTATFKLRCPFLTPALLAARIWTLAEWARYVRTLVDTSETPGGGPERSREGWQELTRVAGP